MQECIHPKSVVVLGCHVCDRILDILDSEDPRLEGWRDWTRPASLGRPRYGCSGACSQTCFQFAFGQPRLSVVEVDDGRFYTPHLFVRLVLLWLPVVNGMVG